MENGDTYTPAEAERLLVRTDKPISERRIRGIDHAHYREAAVPAKRLVVQPHLALRPADACASSNNGLSPPFGSAYTVGGDLDGAMAEVADFDVGVSQVA